MVFGADVFKPIYNLPMGGGLMSVRKLTVQQVALLMGRSSAAISRWILLARKDGLDINVNYRMHRSRLVQEMDEETAELLHSTYGVVKRGWLKHLTKAQTKNSTKGKE